MSYSQDNRLIAINTPLGKDVLLLAGFGGKEGISRLFNFDLTLISEKHDISFAGIIGKSVTISVILADESKRYFNGIVSRFAQGQGGGETGTDSRFAHYHATMVPWPWLLTRTADSRIFQNLSVPDIVEKIFKEKGFSDYKLKLQGSYDKRDFCVQYRETDFNFIARLLEEEGIHFFFEHADGRHTLILADSPQANAPCPKQDTARFHIGADRVRAGDVITGLEKAQEIRAAKYALSDYNFEIPNTDLKVNVPSKQNLGPGEREIYDYPGLYDKRQEGDRRVKLRMEEEEARITTIDGSGNCRAFTSGYRFTLEDFYRDDMNNKDYVLTALEHAADQGWADKSELAYRNHFTCIPFDVPYRPPRTAVKPVVRGSQTAIVVGPSGEEIYTDKHGRIKVQFHWDREGKKNENSSCWIRVGQLWAGPSWGAMYIPRIGHEVIVDFLEGDPDRPIITGRVYHGANMPPYPLPGEKTKSTVKSNSSLGGGGFNEFRFEDKKGKEEIYLHGQKDWTIAILNDKNQTIGHDETLKVANNRTKTVGVNQSETIGVNKSIKVGANHTEMIGSNKTETVAVNTAETIGAAKELTIGALYQVTVGAAMNETIGAAKAEEIGAAKSVNVGADSSENVGKDKSVDAGNNITETAGKKMSLTSGDDFSIQGGKNGVIDIADQLTIKCGSASITLKKNGDITITGKTINVKGSGNIVMKANKILEN